MPIISRFFGIIIRMFFNEHAPPHFHAEYAEHRAVLNIRYVDNAGNPGNIITVAANITGSATAAHPSTWWLVGNQHPVDVAVKLVIRRYQQYNTNLQLPSTATPSGFRSGIQFIINTISIFSSLKENSTQ